MSGGNFVCNIESREFSRMSLVAESGLRLQEFVLIAAVQNNMRTGLGKPFGDCQPNALAGARDQSALAFEAEHIECHAVSLDSIAASLDLNFTRNYHVIDNIRKGLGTGP
jgi:hypothetical protein